MEFRKKVPQVAVILEVANKSTRDMLAGITDYAKVHGPWAMHIIEGYKTGQRLYRFNRWGATGIIGLIQTEEVADYILSANLPTVIIEPENYLPAEHPISKFSTVFCDTESVGIYAAEYLLGLGFKNFAFVGEIRNIHWSYGRGKAFRERLGQEGLSCFLYSKPHKQEESDWGLEIERMCIWLKSLPKPVAILAANDLRGQHVLEACMIAGISVPYEVAVLGVDNDELLCESSFPPMSSLLMNTKEVFYKTAELLDQLMKRKIRKKTLIAYGPKCIIARRSTDPVNCVDKIVSQALDFIWINSGKPLSINSIARELDISRRTLEVRFRDYTGSTILQEINRVRLERARSLLLTTKLSISEITSICGFSSESYLGKLFREKLGTTMSRYRESRMS